MRTRSVIRADWQYVRSRPVEPKVRASDRHPHRLGSGRKTRAAFARIDLLQ